jgi:hypothetical protein
MKATRRKPQVSTEIGRRTISENPAPTADPMDISDMAAASVS